MHTQLTLLEQSERDSWNTLLLKVLRCRLPGFRRVSAS